MHGQLVKPRNVFRSGALSKLTATDHDIIAKLGIRVICDLRATPERLKQPTRLAPSADIEIWARDHESSAGNLLTALSAPGGTTERSRQIMIKIYRSLPYEQADSYREVFLRIATGQLPLLFHCAAGKDRTGIAAALLLDVLGVPRNAVVEDYVLSDAFFQQNLDIALHDLGSSALHHVDQAVWEPMMRADAAYISAFFDIIETRHGSSEGFLREALNLPPETINAIREQLLTTI